MDIKKLSKKKQKIELEIAQFIASKVSELEDGFEDALEIDGMYVNYIDAHEFGKYKKNVIVTGFEFNIKL